MDKKEIKILDNIVDGAICTVVSNLDKINKKVINCYMDRFYSLDVPEEHSQFINANLKEAIKKGNLRLKRRTNKINELNGIDVWIDDYGRIFAFDGRGMN